jgi:hypothetical protein
MDHESKLRQIAFGAALALGAMQGVHAQALSGSAASAAVVSEPATPAALPAMPASGAQTTALTPDEAKQSASGNVAELQQLIRGTELSELRTTYNGTYGASLLFLGKDMTYYVALFQNKTFWRVIKTDDEARAEMIYRDFVNETVRLSNVEIRRTLLAAQKTFTEHLVALQQDRANRLQADLDVVRQQQSIVTSQQQQAHAEATALAQQKDQAQNQLRATQRQVQELQRELDSGLPASPR